MSFNPYGEVYAGVTKYDEDTASILPITESPRDPQYHAYHPGHNTPSNNTVSSRTPSWLVSAVHLQQSLPPEQTLSMPSPTISEPEPSPGMRPSIFGTRDLPQAPYQESIAWANSTYFKPSADERPPEQTIQQPQPSRISHFQRESHIRHDSRRYFRHPRHIYEPWNAGVWKRFPIWGFSALSLILILTAAMVAILIGSNGKTTEDWKLGSDNAQLPVYLSVFEMILNLLTIFALADGMVIRYWRQLLHGTTLSAMHDTYESIHLWPAVKRIVTFRWNNVAVACVAAAASLIRGPFYQRALTLSNSATSPPTYTLHPPFLAVGTFLSVASVLAIASLYHGFWELGRPVSLNPLEIGRAFGAPFLRGLDANATPGMMTVERGGMGIKYGTLERFGEGKDLRVEEMTQANIRMPWDGEVFK
ncbi:hypothetical protein DM02DRAFT_687198 [Periconia macrospinosa]|uniref:Uncharacterized protein n=1 Tax=Periconia macrospinosa TaxID=97972 RepID=A0A2V1E7C2_9PLEO|nr:hypothetical protein DM02DRAFT_687198 [Periconia macrospinosa]